MQEKTKRKADLDDSLYRVYDKIEDVETQLIETKAKKQAIEAEKLTGDNVYKVLVYFEKLYAVVNEVERRQLLSAFEQLYDTFGEAEQRDFMRAFIERILICLKKPENDCWIRNIVFNFPIPVKGKEVRTLPLELQSTVERVYAQRLCA